MKRAQCVFAGLALLLLGGCHAMTCDVGHYETVHVKAHQEMTPIFGGNNILWTNQWVPEHDEKRWVCDHVFDSKVNVVKPAAKGDKK